MERDATSEEGTSLAMKDIGKELNIIDNCTFACHAWPAFSGVPWDEWEKDIKSLEEVAAELKLQAQLLMVHETEPAFAEDKTTYHR